VISPTRGGSTSGPSACRVDPAGRPRYAPGVRFAPWVVLIFVGVVLALLGVAFVPSLVREHHGHMHYPLELTVRVVDRQTGEPLEGALLFTVATPEFIEMGDFELLLDELVRLLDREPEETCGVA